MRYAASHVERQNLTMRMQMRRLTRLTNAFSKKWEKLHAMLALYFAWYNFCLIHQTLRITPAMEAGICDDVWEIENFWGLSHDWLLLFGFSHRISCFVRQSVVEYAR